MLNRIQIYPRNAAQIENDQRYQDQNFRQDAARFIKKVAMIAIPILIALNFIKPISANIDIYNTGAKQHQDLAKCITTVARYN